MCAMGLYMVLCCDRFADVIICNDARQPTLNIGNVKDSHILISIDVRELNINGIRNTDPC